jgi:hypothetical protein
MRSVPVLIGVGAVLVMATAGPALAAGGWTVQYPQNPAGSIDASLYAVSCVSGVAASSSCIAVGNYENAITQVGLTLAESWNGSSWVIQPTPNPAGSSTAQLNGVSCPVTIPATTPSCEAVGQYSDPSGSVPYPLAEGWNGTAWTIQPTPALGIGGILNGVSCVSASFCIAIGQYITSGYSTVNVAEEWNGTAWSQLPLPTPIAGDYLVAVSCPSVHYCVVVGSNLGTGEAVSLIWNDGTWSSVPVPQPAGDSLTALGAVSCSSASACTAVGSAFNAGGTQVVVAERWNGTAWVVQQALNRDDNGSQLTGVSCPTATSCTAIGNSGGADTLAEGWNGSTWTIESTPDPNGPATPLALSCTAVTTCTSTGEYFPNNGDNYYTLAYQYN